jgi:Flp pilus assembly pilin Flp
MEYALLGVLIGVVLVGAFTAIGGNIITVFGVGAAGPANIIGTASGTFD